VHDADLKEVIKLVNWFTAHLCSSYAKADKSTKKHIDKLYLEFNRRWKGLLKGAKNTDTQPKENQDDGR
jgi:hypothetical protein